MENEEINHRIESLEKSNDLILETLIKEQKVAASALAKHIESFEDYHRKLDEGAQSRRDFVKTLDLFYNEVKKVAEYNEKHHQSREYFRNLTEGLKRHIDESKEFIKVQTDKIPTSLQIKHHVAPNSIGVLSITITLLLTTVFSLALAITNYRENKILKDNDIKYRMFRYQLPSLNQTIDSLYYKNPEKAEQVISKLEAEIELRKAAEEKRLEAEKIAREEHRLIK